mgnify:FL=1
MTRTHTLLLAFAGIAALAAGVLLGDRLAGPPPDPLPTIHGTVIAPPQPLPAFRLHDEYGTDFGPERFRGRWTLIYFGYTYCPDVCPTELTTLAELEKRLAAQGRGGDTDYWLITVDPERDTVQRLREYVQFFSKRFHAASGDTANLAALMNPLGVIALRPPGQPDTGYTIDHSSTLTLIDPQGRLHAIFSPPNEVEHLLPELLALQARYAARH